MLLLFYVLIPSLWTRSSCYQLRISYSLFLPDNRWDFMACENLAWEMTLETILMEVMIIESHVAFASASLHGIPA